MADMTEVMAELVAREEMVMYDDASLNDIKKCTVEELYSKLDQELTLKCKPSISEFQLLHESKNIFLYLSELYRRCVPWPELLDWWEYDNVQCECPQGNCELSALIENVEHFTIFKKMQPDELRTVSGSCIRCCVNKDGPILSKEESKLVHEKTIASQFHQIIYLIKKYVKMELIKLRKIKSLQIDSL